MDKKGAVGERVFAIVTDPSTFTLATTKAVVLSADTERIILERADSPLVTTRFEFPAECWGVDIFREEADALAALPGRRTAGGGTAG